MSLSVDDPAALARAEEPQSSDRQSWSWLPPLATSMGLILGVVALLLTSEGEIRGLGLVTALDPMYYLGVAYVVAGAVGELMSATTRRFWFGYHVVAFAFLLHGVTGVVEANPRFPTAYLHVGFADQIATNGSLLQGLDARFNWPGFFAGSALLQQATGGAPVTWALRFFPLAVNLVMVVLVDALGRAAHVSLHRRRAAVLIFLASNWIGQDYFSPQATASVLYLVSILLVVTTFAGRGLGPRWRRMLGSGPQRSLPATTTSRRLGVMAVLALLTAATVTGHQITSGFLALSLLLLAVLGLSGLRAYPFAVGVATVAWLSFAAEPYWSGHLQKLTGSAGRVSTLVQQNVTERAANGSFDRGVVVNSRLAFTGVMVLAVVLSLLVLRRRRQLPVLLGCLVLAPWPMLLLQAYGGEMALRVLLVSLPALSLLAGSLLLPARVRVRASHLVVLALLLVALVPMFLVARYGNEEYERVSSDDLAVLNHVYSEVPGNVLVLTANSKLPRFYDRVDEVRFASIKATVPSDIVTEAEHRAGYKSRYVFLGETQDALGVEVQGLRPGWTRTLARALVATGRFSLEERRGDSILLRLVPAPTGDG